jgi:hypothetical protein
VFIKIVSSETGFERTTLAGTTESVAFCEGSLLLGLLGQSSAVRQGSDRK